MQSPASKLIVILSFVALWGCDREEFNLIYEPLDRNEVVGCYSLREKINFRINESAIVFNGGQLKAAYQYGRAAKTDDETIFLDRRIFLDWSKSMPSQEIILFSDFGKDEQSSAAYGVFRRSGLTSIEIPYYDKDGLEEFRKVSCDLVAG